VTAQSLSPLIVKETRALLPAWLSCAAAMVISSGTTVYPFGEMAIGAYLLGVATLGALSIGHEYGHGTLPLLLAQPVPRKRLLGVKLGVLAVLLAGIGATASVIVLPRVHAEPSIQLAFVLLPLVGLCVAPWLTMVFGSAMAGTVFTLALPGILMTASELLYLAVYGRLAPGRFQTLVLWRGTIACCALGAVMTWRTFLRLEAVAGIGSFGVTAWLPASRTTAAALPMRTLRSPLRLLVAKELRLQRMTFAVAGLYVVGHFAVSALQPMLPFAREIATALSLFYGILIALLVGALASAEERQLGTLPMQQLLPMAAWRQFAVKVALVLSLSVLLAVALPALVVSPSLPTRIIPELGFGAIGLAICGLYVSSVSASGVWAMLLSMPTVFGVLWINELVRVQLSRALGRQNSISIVRLDGGLEPVLAVAFLALLVWLALVNHRSAERSSRHYWAQGLWLTACLASAVAVAVVAGR
jgi:hypothetical protein